MSVSARAMRRVKFKLFINRLVDDLSAGKELQITTLSPEAADDIRKAVILCAEERGIDLGLHRDVAKMAAKGEEGVDLEEFFDQHEDTLRLIH